LAADVGDETRTRTDGLTHLDADGRARMVDVGGKAPTKRRARAEALVTMGSATLALLTGADAPKGDVLAAARMAGIMAAKRTSGLIPLCHPVALSHAAIEIEAMPPSRAGDPASVRIEAVCETTGPTGVEMEALTAASVAALTVYDMLKAVDRGMSFEVRLLSKEGGASGVWERGETP
jgi:cyclic pyranopterin phosphate synthase